MKQIEIIRLSIHLNMLQAKMNMEEKNHDLAMFKIQDARRLLEDLETLVKKSETNKSTFH